MPLGDKISSTIRLGFGQLLGCPSSAQNQEQASTRLLTYYTGTYEAFTAHEEGFTEPQFARLGYHGG
jgi:hypothetical protein